MQQELRQDTIHWENCDVGVRIEEKIFKDSEQSEHYYVITHMISNIECSFGESR